MIEDIRKTNNSKIYFCKGKVFHYVNKISSVSNSTEINNNENKGGDSFARQGNTYLWLSNYNSVQNLSIVENITSELNVLGYIVKDITYTSAQVAVVLAMYIE